jgi:hypothetical protein
MSHMSVSTQDRLQLAGTSLSRICCLQCQRLRYRRHCAVPSVVCARSYGDTDLVYWVLDCAAACGCTVVAYGPNKSPVVPTDCGVVDTLHVQALPCLQLYTVHQVWWLVSVSGGKHCESYYPARVCLFLKYPIIEGRAEGTYTATAELAHVTGKVRVWWYLAAAA